MPVLNVTEPARPTPPAVLFLARLVVKNVHYVHSFFYNAHYATGPAARTWLCQRHPRSGLAPMRL